jgi:hypothetical protein
MHTDHTQLAYYMGRLQKHLIELKLKLPVHTFENRPLQLLTISSPKILRE